MCESSIVIDLHSLQWRGTSFQWRRSIAQDSYARLSVTQQKQSARPENYPAAAATGQHSLRFCHASKRRSPSVSSTASNIIMRNMCVVGTLWVSPESETRPVISRKERTYSQVKSNQVNPILEWSSNVTSCDGKHPGPKCAMGAMKGEWHYKHMSPGQLTYITEELFYVTGKDVNLQLGFKFVWICARNLNNFNCQGDIH